MKADIGANVHNKFEFQLIDKDGNIKQEAIAYNLVTDTYYNRLNTDQSVAFTYVHLGTGTGTPSVSDLHLFNFLAYKATDFANNTNTITYIDTNRFSNSVTVTFTEAEAVGEITEIGLCDSTSGTASGSHLYTHAMITDAEGHVISINKTDTDRLLVTVTVYLNLTLPNFILPFKGALLNCMSLYGNQMITTGWTKSGTTHYTIRRLLGCTGNYNWHMALDQKIRCCLSPGCPSGCASTSTGSLVTMNATTETTSTGVRQYNTSRVLSADMNLPSTYQIYGFMCCLGYIPITSDIFTPLDLTLEQVADGTQTSFNFGVPELMSDVKVYINDELQPASAYTWNGTDYTNSFQAWESSRADKVIETPALLNTGTTSPATRSYPIFNTYFRTQNIQVSIDYVLYDFGSPMTMRRAYKPKINTQYTEWSYSSDNSNWTTLVIPSTAENYYDFPNPVSARYWKFDGHAESYWTNNTTPGVPILCNFSNQLEFNTPPPADAIVKIEAKSAYPIKNENWLVDQFVLDFTISRG